MTRIMTPGGRPLGLIILAGGDGRRMRADKARLPLPGGKTLIEHVIAQSERFFSQVLISVTRDSGLDFLPFEKIEDAVPDQGPMRGLHTALSSARCRSNFVIACDIPEIRIPFVRAMVKASAGFSVTVAVQADGRPEPLFGVYSLSTLPHMEYLLERKKFSLLDLFPLCPTRYVPLDGPGWLRNLNTREEYRRFIQDVKKP